MKRVVFGKKLVILVILVLLGISGVARAQKSAPSFAIKIGTDSANFKYGAPIGLHIVIQNNLNQLLFLHDDRDPVRSGIVVRDSQGNLVRRRHEDGPVFQMGSEIIIEPGKTAKSHVNLFRVYDRIEPGKYAVTVEKMDQVTHNLISSNAVTIDVVP